LAEQQAQETTISEKISALPFEPYVKGTVKGSYFTKSKNRPYIPGNRWVTNGHVLLDVSQAKRVIPGDWFAGPQAAEMPADQLAKFFGEMADAATMEVRVIGKVPKRGLEPAMVLFTNRAADTFWAANPDYLDIVLTKMQPDRIRAVPGGPMKPLIFERGGIPVAAMMPLRPPEEVGPALIGQKPEVGAAHAGTWAGVPRPEVGTNPKLDAGIEAAEGPR
jgi:hypothetical protein